MRPDILLPILKQMRQQAVASFTQMLRDLADELESEPEPLEEYQDNSLAADFDSVYTDR